MVDSARDEHPWRGAIGLGVAFTVIAMTLSLGIERVVGKGWFAPPDIWYFVRASHYIANGALGYVYESTQYIYALPLFPIVMAPVAFLGQSLELTERIPYAVYYPTMWLLVGPYCLAVAGVAALYSVRALTHRAQAPGSPLATQVGMLFLVVLPAALIGHFEDVLAVAFLLLALRSVLNTRYEVTALMLSFAIGFKQWAILALPPLLALIPRGSRLRALTISLALPLSLAVLTLSVDWEHASRALLISPTFPFLGHAVPWLNSDASEASTFGYRLVALGVSLAVAWRLRRGADLSVIMAGLALVFLARAAVEPVPMVYYLAPAFGFLILDERLTSGRQIRTLVIGLPLLAWFAFSPGQRLWWVVYTLGVATLAIPAVRAVFAPSTHRDRANIATKLEPNAVLPAS